MRQGRRVGVAIAVGSLLAACSRTGSDPVPPSTSPPVTEAPTTTTTVVLPQPPPVEWRSCDGGFRCATLTVPVDYADPGGPTIDLALIQRPADDPEARIGTLVMNPGGPGSSGVRRVRRGFRISDEVAARFDIVGFDPRGVGDSEPIRCGSSVGAFRALDLAPDTPDEQRALEYAAAAVADECHRSEGARLAHYGAVDVAHDVEVLRLALREDTLSFVGLSYGTRIGLLWAEAYPSSVRSLVLDGVVDPQDAGTGSSPDQLAAIDQTFSDMAEACTNDPSCPVGPDGGMVAAYDRLAARLEVAADGATGPTQLTYAFFRATYGREFWPRFWRGLHEGLRGDLSGIAELARSFTGLVPYAPFTIITCLDSPHLVGADGWRRDAAEAAAVSPRFGAALANELLPCAFLPAATFQPHRVVAAGAPPILVVGSTGDVATPYAQAVEVARRLESGVLLTVDLQGHVAIGASPCADAAITRYLVDGVPPGPGARC